MKNFFTVLCMLVGVPLGCRADEYHTLLEQARRHMFNEEYSFAAEKAALARKHNSQDAESYEVRTFSMLFKLKKELDINGLNPIADKRKLWEHHEDLEHFEREITEGLRLARKRVYENPADERAWFLVGKLQLNKLLLILQILNKKTGRREYLEARKIMDGILLTNPNHCRALVASGWMNYIIGTRGFFERLGLALLGISGDKQKGIGEIVHASDPATACAFLDKVEARFSLLEILKKEQQWPQMYAVAKELKDQFPKNTQLKKYMELAAKQIAIMP